MGRRHRFLPQQGLVEVTTRTLHARHLLTPSPELNEIIGGCLGRALEVHPLELIAYSFLGNHGHLLIHVQNHHRLSQFMSHFNGNLAKEVGRLTGWKDKIWGRRFDPVPISDEPTAQIERLRYVLANGVKEGLVEKVLDWPGVHAAKQIVHGEPLTGVWFDRTKEWASWRDKEPKADKYRFATRYEIELTPLPCWRHLDPDAYREEVARLISEIEALAAMEREKAQKEVLGVSGVLDQNPLDSPRNSKKSPRPLIHAATRRVRREYWMAYREFEAAYVEASAKLRRGEQEVEFPERCYPPAFPFTGEISESLLPPPEKKQAEITPKGESALPGTKGCAFVRMRTFWWSSVMESAADVGSAVERNIPARARGQPP